MTADEYGFINRTAFDVYEEGKGEFVVLGDLSFRAQNGELFTVPSGFITNFASYPLVGRMVYGVNDDSRYGAVLHDYLYATQCVSRERADELFLEALESRGVRYTKRKLMYYAVRAFGGANYSNTDTVDFVPDSLKSKYMFLA